MNSIVLRGCLTVTGWDHGGHVTDGSGISKYVELHIDEKVYALPKILIGLVAERPSSQFGITEEGAFEGKRIMHDYGEVEVTITFKDDE